MTFRLKYNMQQMVNQIDTAIYYCLKGASTSKQPALVKP